MKILIIDDSVVSRRLVTDALASTSGIETISAPSGKIGLNKIEQQLPDLVTLDVEMPEMNGIETLKKIRQKYPKLPVIMVSRLTEQGAAATIDALFFGANDYVAKPEAKGGISQAIRSIRQQLLPKINALCKSSSINTADNQVIVKQSGTQGSHLKTVKIIAIGSSTGGPNALETLLTGLAGHLTVTVVIAQHTLPVFSKHIASRLSDKTGLQVKQGQHGALLNSNDIWLAPGDQHMLLNIKKQGIQLETMCSTEQEAIPSVDRLFNSIANIYGAGVLAVVLTGMGKDGLDGCRSIRKCSGQILVQDEQSSVVWGMPGAVAKAGLADEILPLNSLAAAIINRLNN